MQKALGAADTFSDSRCQACALVWILAPLSINSECFSSDLNRYQQAALGTLHTITQLQTTIHFVTQILYLTLE